MTCQNVCLCFLGNVMELFVECDAKKVFDYILKRLKLLLIQNLLEHICFEDFQGNLDIVDNRYLLDYVRIHYIKRNTA